MSETAPLKDSSGNEIAGSARRCFVEMELPPGLSEADKRSRDAIERACRKAVYEDGLTEYGNKQLCVGSFGDIFSNDFERVSIIKLLPPDKAELFRAENGKGVSLDVKDESEPASYDDEDEDEDDDTA